MIMMLRGTAWLPYYWVALLLFFSCCCCSSLSNDDNNESSPAPPSSSFEDSVEHLMDREDELPPIPPSIVVGAYYYPWHADDFHRNDGYLRDLLDPRQQPTLGEYDDTKPEVIGQHLAWSRQANIRMWACSWWGPGNREDVAISQHIMTHSDLGDHKIALLYESLSRIKKQEEHSTQRVQPDMEHICQTYLDHPNYYRIDDKPVIFMYLTRVLSNIYDSTTGLNKLQEVVEIMRETARDFCDKEIYIIGDQVWSTGPSDGATYAPFEWLDAVTNYDLYGNTNSPPYAGQLTVDKYYKRQGQWRNKANGQQVGYVPAVSPGYNDRGVRLQANHIGLSRRLTQDDEPGSLFVAQIQQARYLTDNVHAGNLLMVNSFNEWHEDSQIEPCSGESTREPLEYTNGIMYEGYGEMYLNILRATTCNADSNKNTCTPYDKDNRWKSIALQDDPMNGPPPEDILVGAYYFAWWKEKFANEYGSKFLRNHLDDTNQMPMLGETYDDKDPFVIGKHLEYSRQANIGLWIVSWSGPDNSTDSTLLNVILPHSDLGQIKIALLYQVRRRFSETDLNLETIKSDIHYMCTSYLEHANYYTVHGKPVVFVALTRLLSQKGFLETILGEMKAVASQHGYELYLVGDQVWGSAPLEEIYLPFFELDAVTNYDIYGNMGGPQDEDGYAGQEVVDKYYSRQRVWRDKAWKSNCAFVPAVTPGFNDRGNRLAKNHAALSRHLTNEEGDAPGSFFAESLRQARYLVDSDLGNLLIVNSFNQWQEDTQIEPVQGDMSSTPESYTQGLTYYGYKSLYLDILKNATENKLNETVVSTRSFETRAFHPLQCNVIAQLADKNCNTKWTSIFGTDTLHESEVVIPCAACIILDHPGPLLQLMGGLDIQGKLVIPDGYQVEIEVPYIRVQGFFEINSNKVIDGTPDVRIAMVEGAPGIQKFQPSTTNVYSCGVQRCDPGPQSIVVAGGQLNIQAIPDETPAWVHLIDVVTESVEPPFRKPIHCASNGIYITESFESESSSKRSSSSALFSRTLGSQIAFQDSMMKIFDRKSTYHGAQIDLSSIRDCLGADESYTIAMTVRVTQEDGMHEESMLTQCATLGQNCIQIISDHMDENEILSSLVKYNGPARARFKYGQWMVLETQVQFGLEELDPNNMFLALRIAGGEQDANIEVRDFSLQIAPEDACSTSPPDCRDLVACNGDAGWGISASPFGAKGEAQIRVEVDDDGNHFWRIVREESSSVLAGIEWNVPNDCIVENAVYRFRMRIRHHSPDPVETGVYMRLHREDGSSQKRIVVCPASMGEWIDCDGYVVVDDGMSRNLGRVTMFFETVGASDTMYDVDDLSFTFVHMEGNVIGLVVGKEVKGKWGEGSQVLITSHTLNWNEQHVRKIVSVEHVGEDGSVLLELNAPIPRPPTQKTSDFPVEVALLSRNVLFEGGPPAENGDTGGGHLTVYYTPKVVQVIEGAEFRNFGQQGKFNRYPILFHYSQSVEGSLVAKNTIRQSQQSCIVLAGTDDVVVEENIAFNTAGPCFVLKDGMETGNTFYRNLGASTHRADIVDPRFATDDPSPPTFFIANPNNKVENNVGAGSQGEAFAIILQSQVNGIHAREFDGLDPAKIGLNNFRNNVAHSNQVRGFHLRMTPKYRSQSTKMLLNGLYAYRNAGTGALIIDSENVVVDESYFMDNRGGIGLHRSESVLVNNTSVVGMSDEMRLLEATQLGLSWKLCPNRQASLIGVKMHSFTRARQGNGLELTNIDFTGFEDIKICKEEIFSVDPATGWGKFDLFTQMSKVRVEDGAPRFNLCQSVRNEIRDVYVIDQDSSLKPHLSSAIGVSSIVSDTSKALKFIPQNKRVHEPDLCYYYCEDTCLRTVVFSIDPADGRDLTLKICVRGEQSMNCASYEGTTYFEPLGPSTSSFVTKGMYYYVTLPKGRYEAAFLDRHGSRSWPRFVEESYSDSLCDNSLSEGSVWLPAPPETIDECSELIRNGDAEMIETGYPFWIAGPGGMRVLPDMGLGLSRGFCDISPSLGKYSFGQYVDARCLVENRVYRVQAGLRLMDSKTGLSMSMKCPDASSCPKAGFLFVSNDGYSWIHEINNDNIFAVQQYQENNIGQHSRLRRRMTNDASNGYELVGGKLLVTPEMASASSAFFFFSRSNQDGDVVFCLDEVSLTLNNAIML